MQYVVLFEVLSTWGFFLNIFGGGGGGCHLHENGTRFHLKRKFCKCSFSGIRSKLIKM